MVVILEGSPGHVWIWGNRVPGRGDSLAWGAWLVGPGSRAEAGGLQWRWNGEGSKMRGTSGSARMNLVGHWRTGASVPGVAVPSAVPSVHCPTPRRFPAQASLGHHRYAESPTSPCISIVHSFFLLNSIPLCGRTSICLSSYLLLDH